MAVIVIALMLWWLAGWKAALLVLAVACFAESLWRYRRRVFLKDSRNAS